MEDLTQIHNLPQAEQDAILAGPALALPPGISEPRFDNPPNGDALAYTAVTLCLVLSTLAVFIRFYAKCIRVKKITVEESKCTPVNYMFRRLFSQSRNSNPNYLRFNDRGIRKYTHQRRKDGEFTKLDQR